MSRPRPFAKQLWQLDQMCGDLLRASKQLSSAICSELLADKHDLDVIRDDLGELLESVHHIQLFLDAVQYITDDALGYRGEELVWDADVRSDFNDALDWLDAKQGKAGA